MAMGRKALREGVQLNLAILYRLACLFLKRGADLRAQDSEGRDPLTIAMETANADIVTL
jgi:ankyrin repeat protein